MGKEIIIGIKFNHKREILALKEGFPKYFSKYVSTKVEWEKEFAENNFRNAYISGKGKNEKLILSTAIIIDSKGLPVKFVEDMAGELTIEISGKTVYTIKPSGRISQSLLKAFTKSIIEGNQ